MRNTILRNVTRLFHSARQVFRVPDRGLAPRKRHPQCTRFRPTLEILETREMPAGITITPVTTLSTPLVTTGAGGTATFTVALASPPLLLVTLGLTSSNPNEGTLSTTSLVFNSLDWSTPQTVTLTGQNDGVMQSNQPYTVTVSVNLLLTTDLSYLLGVPPQTVYAINLNPNVAVTVASSAPSGSTYGSNVTFTADVAPFTGLPTPTGTVQFVVDGSNFGSPVAVDGSGDATLTTNTLSAGTHTVVADYIPALGSQYLGTSGTLAGGQLVNKADASIIVNPYTLTYDGNSHTDTGTATGALGEDLSSLLDLSGTTHTNAGTYTDSWTFSGDSNYNSTSGIVADIIGKANATITVNGYSVTYDGNSHTASGTATGVIGEDLSSELDLSDTTHTNAGTYTDTWTFSGDSNYNSASGSVSDSIAKADAIISVSGYTGVYDGNAQGATGTATGVLGEDLSSELNLGAQFTNVPGGTAFWTFTDTTGNYNDASGSVAIVINKADASITVDPYNVTYDGNAHIATGTATGVVGEDLSNELHLSGTTHTNAGSYTDTWTFTDTTGNYNNASGTVTDTISKANASITVNGYTVTYDGTSHTASGTATGALGEDLSSELDLSGTTHTDAGTYTDTWTFTDTTGNYNDASGTVSDSIAKANATISVSSYSVTYDGNSHTATGTATGVLGEDLSALLDLTATTHTNAGTYSDTWTFAGNSNYNSDSGSISDGIAQRDATWTTNDAGKTYGTADPTPLTTGSGTGFVASDDVTATYGRAAGETVGSYVITATLTAAGDLANYNISNAGATFTISPATLTVTADNQTRLTGDPNPTLAYGFSGFQNGETLAISGVTGAPVVTTAATQASAPGVYTISIGLGTLQATNYTFKLVSGRLTVTAPVSPSTGGGSGTGVTNASGSGSGTIVSILNPPGTSGGTTGSGSQGGSSQTTEPSSPPNNAGPPAGTGQGVVLAQAGGKVISGDEQPVQPAGVPLHIVAAPPGEQPRPVVAPPAEPPRQAAAAPAAAGPELLPAPASSILENQLLLKALDNLHQQVDAKPDLQVQLAGTVTIGIAVTVGYVLLAGRAVLWLLMALTARPMWRQFDPLDVIYAWEQEKDKRRAEAEGKEESLQSIVENH